MTLGYRKQMTVVASAIFSWCIGVQLSNGQTNDTIATKRTMYADAFRANNRNAYLHRAIMRNDFSEATQLLRSGVSVDIEDAYGNSPIHYVTSVEGVEYLLKHGADINKTNSLGQTVLHRLADYGLCVMDMSLYEYLLGSGVNVNATTSSGKTPLHYAWHNPWLAKMLLSAGAIVGVRDNEGISPMFLALTGKGDTNSVKVVELFRGAGAELSAVERLWYSCYKGESSRVEEMLRKGEIEFRSVVANTALLYAVESKNSQLVESLVAKGADVNVRSYGGMTPLHFAAQEGDIATVEVLLKTGANKSAIAEGWGRCKPVDVATTEQIRVLLSVPE